ncbi:hypothetical protein N7491_008465 [Penicillium cf. griseofulvum]|uniref:Major facilitator superfamily (MFS) profile domain-containing protein n=1 Tax=Penicillium cf. griseofulvum TaxID=2972120 RepID=A0A9W9MG81_9EURO|nr:hypothetical protein N7472_005932 [Penicillium cf. griseofulvum]KAJ5423249.1 hypothetical protein N7491_008465 [Penicillium cf. griseofulvum]
MAVGGNRRLCFWVAFAVESVLLVYFCLFFEETKYIPHIEARILDASPERPSSAKKKDSSSASEDVEPITPQVTNTTHGNNPEIPLLACTWNSFLILFHFPAVMYTALTYAFCLCWVSAQGSLVSIVFTQPPYNFGELWIIMFGVTASKGMHWIYLSVGGGFGLGAVSDVALCLLIDSYQAITGEAFIGVAFTRNLFSIGVSFAIVPWMDAQGVQNMCIVMGVWATAMGFIHVSLIIWGKKIREKTANKYQEMARESTVSALTALSKRVQVLAGRGPVL